MEYNYILNYLQSNINLFIDEIKITKYSHLFFSKTDEREYWNSCFYFDRNCDLKRIEGEFYLRNLNPSFWILDDDKKTLNILETKGYIKRKLDYWMIFDKKISFDLENFNIKTVVTKKQIEDYISVFRSEYNDPYLKYQNTLENRLVNANIKSYILYKDDYPVTIISIIETNGIGLIQSVVTRKEYRQKGFGSIVCKYAINRSNVEVFMLKSDAESLSVNMYTKLGFRELMKINILSKKIFKDYYIYKNMRKYLNFNSSIEISN